MTIAVVTTFHKAGYDLYGKRMIQSFLQQWPSEVRLYVYAEDCAVEETAPNLFVRDLHASSPELVAFKAKWKDVPKANGDVSNDPVRSNAEIPARDSSGMPYDLHTRCTAYLPVQENVPLID